MDTMVKQTIGYLHSAQLMHYNIKVKDKYCKYEEPAIKKKNEATVLRQRQIQTDKEIRFILTS